GDPRWADLPGERLQPADDAGPQRVRKGEMASWLHRRERRDRDDPSSGASLEMGKGEVDEAHEGREQELERLVERVWSDVERAPGRRSAAVPHEDVEAAERSDGLLDSVLEIAWDCDIAADREPTDSLRLALEQVAPSPDERDVGSLGRKRLCGGKAESG